ncbi:Sec-independent protein translocase protein TatB [Gordonia sp. NB41Y]|uniref:Sec-independent protein translocase protein TatB n=1 Tax=Gordonia sp. NB41Y TaxID=875808 RepID=UPI00273CA091|nr:Sec-independent protein translocase protein TatB [Gordonia sp. NB41Y]WLP91477.1 Sec-independent protein translocase protein TatB [Gordonia sp. NB41Y]
MFSSIGWGEIVVLIAAGLIILGPERLPGAISWTMQSIRKVRDYATGASDQLKNELGPEFDDLRKPLSDLNELRGMTPKALVTKHLLNGDDSVLNTFTDAASSLKSATEIPPVKPVSSPVPTPPEPAGPSLTKTAGPASTPGADSSARSQPAADPAHTPAKGSHDITDWDAT